MAFAIPGALGLPSKDLAVPERLVRSGFVPRRARPGLAVAYDLRASLFRSKEFVVDLKYAFLD